jgi:hypothetical protein
VHNVRTFLVQCHNELTEPLSVSFLLILRECDLKEPQPEMGGGGFIKMLVLATVFMKVLLKGNSESRFNWQTRQSRPAAMSSNLGQQSTSLIIAFCNKEVPHRLPQLPTLLPST